MTALLPTPTTIFRLTDDLTAAEPPEQRGLSRDGVRLLVAQHRPDQLEHISHHRFRELPDFLGAGDLLVVNNSETLAGEIEGSWRHSEPVIVHFATGLDDGTWVVELRSAPDGAAPVLTATAGEVVRLPQQLTLRLIEAYGGIAASPTGEGNRLWRAEVDSAVAVAVYLARYGRPISYGYLRRHWPLRDYQTVFSREPGSAEMPSAGRPFTTELVTELVSRGVGLAPITLHTGVSSQDAGEPPQPERFEVGASTARLVNQTRRAGGRVVAVGTTVTRALESAADDAGEVQPCSGWTEHIVGGENPARVVTGLITGLHNPEASHLLLVESVAGARLTQLAYDAAVAHRYLWHEFGDSCLLLP
ncbi:S-adenosylmethionine:tRNA ribosyltransferase-isomerase [Jatrophihabitans sp. GAS493]|uniref:S-adenosylmethionine:tRNA ribosyltransferase-isomerase n=1 Tax=Jatrophihabitans sp. GAS493 TaxID=1907575 RepID=UPI000BB8BE28|nr:S-adenosylmethionine:tRNA ribosyltransferase-isomerase [Jatrophihabitans sp. GAS493]SOD74802.1 S-adenosylmethionine:tRNA ribosyltransferase-isomerase [Jatrophihabitans sp. GAS493]